VSYTPQTAYWTFELGRIFVNNIYKIFQDSGIAIPAGDLYLERIEFVQQLLAQLPQFQALEIFFQGKTREAET
jgi:hypothetical protein